MQMADNFSARPPLPQHLPPAEQNSTSPPPVWWMRLRLESVYRRLEAVQARMALLQRLGGQSVRSRRVYRRLAQEAAALLLAAGLLLTPASGPLHAASITVDGTTCTLAEAITSANADSAGGNGCVDGSGADTITLQGNVTLTVALPDISSIITIEGAGFTIERDSGASEFRIFNVTSSGDLTLNNATVSGGAISSNHGGGIRNYTGTVTLNNSTVSDNSAIHGGGIWTLYGTVTLNNSTVSGNSAGYGGGIDAYGGGTTLNNSTVSGNSATAGAGVGGGIRAQPNTGGTLHLNNSTVSGNSAFGGGGLFLNNNTYLHHSLITGNSAGTGSEVAQPGGTVNAADYNLFGHSGNNNATAFFAFTPSGSDIDATSDGGNPIALASILNTTLADNGGPTMTHALVSGSPAIDAIPSGSRMARSGDGVAASPVLCTPPNTSYDQRGVFRANGTTTGSNCDIGAFEFGATPTAVTIASFTSQTAWGVGPQLAWETGSESGLSGFHIWRGTGDAAETRLTDALIGAAGGLNGHEYTWQDSATFGWGQRTYYWLEAVNGDGSSSFTGPVEVWGIGRLFLPVTGR